MESKVVWKKDALTLKKGIDWSPDTDEEARVLVDTFSTLYLKGDASCLTYFTFEIAKLRSQTCFLFLVEYVKSFLHIAFNESILCI
jgi:hypothetical protein